MSKAVLDQQIRALGVSDHLREIADPVAREKAARLAIHICRQVRAEALRELHRKLGSWAKVGEAVGLPRQDCWRMARG
jgi:hypothetical protein